MLIGLERKGTQSFFFGKTRLGKRSLVYHDCQKQSLQMAQTSVSCFACVFLRAEQGTQREENHIREVYFAESSCVKTRKDADFFIRK